MQNGLTKLGVVMDYTALKEILGYVERIRLS
jgi:hypothetical protein